MYNTNVLRERQSSVTVTKKCGHSDLEEMMEVIPYRERHARLLRNVMTVALAGELGRTAVTGRSWRVLVVMEGGTGDQRH